jgi:large subunit ribosomal protein L21
MDSGVRHQVGLELCDINVKGTVESQGGSQGGDNLGDNSVKVSVGWSLDVEVSTANIVDCLVIEHDGNVNIGAPYVGGASISASVLSHVQGDKVIVFHKKRRKGHRKKNGHRQQFTKIQIDAIKG